MALVLTQGITDYLSDVNGNEPSKFNQEEQSVETAAENHQVQNLVRETRPDQVKDIAVASQKSVDPQINGTSSGSNRAENCILGSGYEHAGDDLSQVENSPADPSDDKTLLPPSNGEEITSSQIQEESSSTAPDNPITSELPPDDVSSSLETLNQTEAAPGSGRYEWHHFCGRNIQRKESLEFYRQVDHLDIWTDQWSHHQVNAATSGLNSVLMRFGMECSYVEQCVTSCNVMKPANITHNAP